MFIEKGGIVFPAHREANEFLLLDEPSFFQMNGAINIRLLTGPLGYNLALANAN